ncbi:transposase domain protein [Shigella flexneri K-218]|nr:transposase domain protein [Shigella flexneri K-218]
MPCFTAMRAEIALMSGSAFAVTHHAFSSGAGRTSDGNGSHASTLKSPSYTKSVSWQHYRVTHTCINWHGKRPVYDCFEIWFC